MDVGQHPHVTRYICDEVSDTGPVAAEPRLLSVVAFNVPGAARDDFDAWYSWEHIPLLMTAEGWLRVRRYHVRDGGVGKPVTDLALHNLRDRGRA